MSNEFIGAVYFDAKARKYLSLRILVLGHGGHGKDEFAERLADKVGLIHTSSSMFCAERVVFPWFQKHAPSIYSSAKECFDGRAFFRAAWFQAISVYNTPKSRLAREIMATNDVYIGLRCKVELDACVEEDVFTHTFWVDAGDRVEQEPDSSMTIEFNPDTMIMVDNSSDLKNLQEEVKLAAKMLGFN